MGLKVCSLPNVSHIRDARWVRLPVADHLYDAVRHDFDFQSVDLVSHRFRNEIKESAKSPQIFPLKSHLGRMIISR